MDGKRKIKTTFQTYSKFMKWLTFGCCQHCC